MRLALAAALLLSCKRSDAPIVESARSTTTPDAQQSGGEFVRRALGLEAASLEGRYAMTLDVQLRNVGEVTDAEVAFEAPPGHCYRVLAASGIDVEAFTLTLLAADGRTELDRADALHSVTLGTTRPLCPPRAARYIVRITSAQRGEVGVAVYATP